MGTDFRTSQYWSSWPYQEAVLGVSWAISRFDCRTLTGWLQQAGVEILVEETDYHGWDSYSKPS